jgi:D-lactate dehydrogenase (cytochrome)
MRSLDELAETSKVIGNIIHRAQEMDGTCSGEHGIGMTKKKYLRAELGDGTLHMMKTIKDAIDPLGIMNPGKLCMYTTMDALTPDPDELMIDPKWPAPATPCC